MTNCDNSADLLRPTSHLVQLSITIIQSSISIKSSNLSDSQGSKHVLDADRYIVSVKKARSSRISSSPIIQPPPQTLSPLPQQLPQYMGLDASTITPHRRPAVKNFDYCVLACHRSDDAERVDYKVGAALIVGEPKPEVICYVQSSLKVYRSRLWAGQISRLPDQEGLFGLKNRNGRMEWFAIKNQSDFHVSLASQLRVRGDDDLQFKIETKMTLVT